MHAIVRDRIEDGRIEPFLPAKETECVVSMIVRKDKNHVARLCAAASVDLDGGLQACAGE